MIDLEKFLKADVPVSPEDLQQMIRLSSDYPWFSIIHQLILAGYKQNNNALYFDKCRQIAAYTLDRKRLHAFLRKISECIQAQSYRKKNNNVATDNNNDALLSTFGNEYFSLEELSPIDLDTQNNDKEPDDALISKFISENPCIIPQPSSSLSSSSISDLDTLIQIDEDFYNDPASETLAQIYASQNLYELAISTYEKLSLLNPEKSIYFASIIDDLKEKMN